MSDMTPERLAELEQIGRVHVLYGDDVDDLCTALREAWAERDEAQSQFEALCCSVREWNQAIKTIIGRVPKTGFEDAD